MELNLISLAYLLLRLAPLLVVVLIVLISLIMGDIRGFVYLLGLSLAVLAPTLFSSAPAAGSAACNLLTVQGIPVGGSLSLSQVALGFSFTYLLYSTTKFDVLRPARNLYLSVLFPAIIAFDFVFGVNNQCMGMPMLAASLAYAGGAGMFWAYMMHAVGLSRLAFFSSNAQIPHCSVPSNQKFKCRMYRAGQLIG